MKMYRKATKKTAAHEGTITVQDMGSRGNTIPIIALRGKWLMKAGFYPKDRVRVEASDGQITITLTEEAPVESVLPWQRRDYTPEPPTPSTGPKIDIPRM